LPPEFVVSRGQGDQQAHCGGNTQTLQHGDAG
jgi:hypothetical protein